MSVSFGLCNGPSFTVVNLMFSTLCSSLIPSSFFGLGFLGFLTIRLFEESSVSRGPTVRLRSKFFAVVLPISCEVGWKIAVCFLARSFFKPLRCMIRSASALRIRGFLASASPVSASSLMGALPSLADSEVTLLLSEV